DVIEVCGDSEVLTVEWSLQRLPTRGDRRDDLTVVLVTDLDRHRKGCLIRLPAVGDSVSLRVELQLEHRDGSVAEVFVEDGCEVASGVLIKERDHVRGHDGLILEVLIVVVEK